MDTLLGFIMIYSWVHATILIYKNTDFTKFTGYEKAVMIVGLVSFVLLFIGVIME